MSGITVSVVIPTRNRPASLETVLRTLEAQERVPDEVIVIDASDDPLDTRSLRAAHPRLRLSIEHSPPSLCAQRNRGVDLASGELVFLCDDDVEPPPDYLRRLVDFLEEHPEVGAASGWIYDADVAVVPPVFPAPSFRGLVHSFMFQLGVSGNVEEVSAPWHARPILRGMQRWYRQRGNTWSLGGWPLITQVRGREVRATVWVLAAALVRRSWLLDSRYDERLDRFDPHAIGDNYGVSISFPEVPGVTVLTDLMLPHRRSPQNRLDVITTQRHRLFALHHFVCTKSCFSLTTRVWLGWSLLGRGLLQLAVGQAALARVTLGALGTILLGRNPLVREASADETTANFR